MEVGYKVEVEIGLVSKEQWERGVSVGQADGGTFLGGVKIRDDLAPDPNPDTDCGVIYGSPNALRSISVLMVGVGLPEPEEVIVEAKLNPVYVEMVGKGGGNSPAAHPGRESQG